MVAVIRLVQKQRQKPELHWPERGICDVVVVVRRWLDAALHLVSCKWIFLLQLSDPGNYPNISK